MGAEVMEELLQNMREHRQEPVQQRGFRDVAAEGAPPEGDEEVGRIRAREAASEEDEGQPQQP
eukprot:2387524-Prorocentrum_lima.AAC.1